MRGPIKRQGCLQNTPVSEIRHASGDTLIGASLFFKAGELLLWVFDDTMSANILNEPAAVAWPVTKVTSFKFVVAIRGISIYRRSAPPPAVRCQMFATTYRQMFQT